MRASFVWSVLGGVLLTGCSTTNERLEKLIYMRQVADRAYAAGLCEQAVSYYEELAAKAPGEVEALLRVGNCHAREKRWEAAEAAYQQALRRKPDYGKAWHNLAYVQANVLAETVALMSQAVDEKDPEFTKVQTLVLKVLKPFGLETLGVEPES